MPLQPTVAPALDGVLGSNLGYAFRERLSTKPTRRAFEWRARLATFQSKTNAACPESSEREMSFAEPGSEREMSFAEAPSAREMSYAYFHTRLTYALIRIFICMIIFSIKRPSRTIVHTYVINHKCPIVSN